MDEKQDYTPIDWSEIRKGDVLMHENGDRLTVKDSYTTEGLVRTVRAKVAMAVDFAEQGAKDLGFTPYRRVPDVSVVPTEMGAYHDKEGVLWVRNESDHRVNYTADLPWYNEEHGYQTVGYMADLAPFTPLVPMPTEEQVLKAMEWEHTYATAAKSVLRLLRGEGGES